MFTELLDEAMGTPAAGLDEQLRASELALRDAQARHAAVVAVIEHRGAFREVDGHRSMNAYLRATCNSSTVDAGRQRLIARACAAAPELGDALLAGRIGVPQVLELARVHQNPRTRRFFERVVPVYLPIAEQASHDDLRLEVDRFVALADQDGAFAELFCDIENRTSNVHVVGGSLHVRVTGGDPLVAEEVLKTFEWFVEREFDRDVAQRAAQHGDRAVEHPLARTDAQRRFDAVVAMARAARSYGDGAKPADIVVNVVTDPHSLVDAFAEAELVVETDDGVETIELDDVWSTTSSPPLRRIRSGSPVGGARRHGAPSSIPACCCGRRSPGTCAGSWSTPRESSSTGAAGNGSSTGRPVTPRRCW